MRTEEPKYYSTVQAARVLGVTADTVREWCIAGKIEAIKLPGGALSVWRIPRHLSIFHPEDKFEQNSEEKKKYQQQAEWDRIYQRHMELRVIK